MLRLIAKYQNQFTEKIANQNLQSTIEELENQPIISEILKSFDGTIEPDSISTKE